MRVNREIRVPKVRVIGSTGEQVGIMTPREAMALAEQEGCQLVTADQRLIKALPHAPIISLELV